MTMPTSPQCPKCHSPMQVGYLVDQGHGNARNVATWSGGEPRRSFWMGLKATEEAFETRTWRCTGCGYLESYAPAT